MIKTLIFSLFTCSLLGFSMFEENSAQILKTQDDIFIIPNGVDMSDEDAASIMQILNQQDEAVGSIQYNNNGQTTRHGEINMSEVEVIEEEYHIDILPTEENGIFGWLIFKRNVKCETQWNNGECDQHYKFIESAGGDLLAPDDRNRLMEILINNGYTEVQ